MLLVFNERGSGFHLRSDMSTNEVAKRVCSCEHRKTKIDRTNAGVPAGTSCLPLLGGNVFCYAD
jgi:hypothetical protein